VGSNPAKDDGFLRCQLPITNLRHSKKPYEHEKMLCRQNSAAIPQHVSPALLLDDSAGKNCQRVLADEPGSIKNSREAVGFPATTQKAFKD
jgi:hypothetical protein